MTDLRTHRNVNSGQVGTKKARITKAPLGSHEWRTQFLQLPRGCRKVIHDWAEVMPLLQVQHPKVGSSYLWLREGLLLLVSQSGLSTSESRYPGVGQPLLMSSLTAWSPEAEASLHFQIAF